MPKVTFRGMSAKKRGHTWFYCKFTGLDDPEYLKAQKFLKRHKDKRLICTIEVAKAK